ncbi:MAG: hypothetical protein ACLFQB_09375 [Chitinispirillaceae bacterium]
MSVSLAFNGTGSEGGIPLIFTSTPEAASAMTIIVDVALGTSEMMHGKVYYQRHTAYRCSDFHKTSRFLCDKTMGNLLSFMSF